MKTKIKLMLAVAVAALMMHTLPVAAQASKGKVLIVMSGGHILTLADGKAYATGYYLNEVAVPLQALVDAGYTPVFANPNGDTPSMDASSNVDKFFGGDANKRMKALRFLDSFAGLHHPRLLSSIVGHTQDYVAVFVPGGHAPMIDLVKDKNLGLILRDFHKNGRPTALICHGPMGLLSTLPETDKYNKELVAGHFSALGKLAHDFPYAGYKIAVFSKPEEKMIETPQLGGPAPYYNDEALAAAGLKVENNKPWQPKVVQDRELITGQQPFSDHAFADALIAKIAASRR
ncbi:type 1 glutamine amidotransferase domain-containing protein [Mucilaginibacter endophyticus]|uniref:type 1 glutamine amidotransferase domain-containing protein n=1 Tax=Mucilaginibacter endophyticus TaxID=2675003 RepID=UPI000E0D6E9C|nr:type 1 glutamine amidotransferase domain-containing protein [Mucilaginibacter endophyticus]